MEGPPRALLAAATSTSCMVGHSGAWSSARRAPERDTNETKSRATRTHSEGGLREARRARADVISKLGRGERVFRSRETLGEYAEHWLPTLAGQLRERTLHSYRLNLNRHVLPRLGQHKVAEIRTDDIAGLIAELQTAGYAGWTIRTILTPLSCLLSHAARRA